MRVPAAAFAAFVVVVVASAIAGPRPAILGSAAFGGAKPHAARASGADEKPRGFHQASARAKPPRNQTDACQWANDRECDDPDIGTGACPIGTDYSDCRYLREGESNACRWANDGECDEPHFGTGSCVMGSDLADCGDVARLRFRNDVCEFAFNDICDEADMGGTGRCERRTDRADCIGRDRPMTINDHYFGRDDRVRVDVSQTPWAQVGVLRMHGGETCTATLVAENVIVTAAHCIHGEDNRVNARGTFTAAAPGGPHTARVIAYLIDPAYNFARFNAGDDLDGKDWALLRLDRPLGARVGFIRVRNVLGPPGTDNPERPDLYQAGYGWDTGDHLAANVRCRIIRIFDDGTFAHNCDTTRGDSGSALMGRVGDEYFVAGVDSNFRSNPGGGDNSGAFLYIAASAAGFESRVGDFAAGRTGRLIDPPRTPRPTTKPAR